MLDPKTRAAVRAAADFFEANPDKRTTVALARDKNRFPVSPSSPKATCWCALGRIAKELGLRERNGGPESIYHAFRRRGLDYPSVYAVNDRTDDTMRVVNFLRALASA